MDEAVAVELMRQLTSIRRTLRRPLRATLGAPPLPSSHVQLLQAVHDAPGAGRGGPMTPDVTPDLAGDRQAAGPAAVQARGLRYRFGATVAVDNVDLTVAPGEVFGLLGPNGAGKTTTLRMIITVLPVREGSVRVFGIDVRARKMAVRRLIGYVPQMLSAD